MKNLFATLTITALLTQAMPAQGDESFDILSLGSVSRLNKYSCSIHDVLPRLVIPGKIEGNKCIPLRIYIDPSFERDYVSWMKQGIDAGNSGDYAEAAALCVLAYVASERKSHEATRCEVAANAAMYIYAANFPSANTDMKREDVLQRTKKLWRTLTAL